jgi:hypothetical protein
VALRVDQATVDMGSAPDLVTRLEWVLREAGGGEHPDAE